MADRQDDASAVASAPSGGLKPEVARASGAVAHKYQG